MVNKKGGDMEIAVAENRGKLIGIDEDFNNLILSFISAQDVKEVSKRVYSRALKQFIIWIKGKGVVNPTRETILAYKEGLRTKGLSSLTLSGYLVAVRKFFEWLESVKRYPNIAKGIKGGKQTRDFRKDPLTVEQIGRLLKSIDRETSQGKRDFALLNLLIRTGLRTIEVIRADVGDIRQEGGEAVLQIQGKGRDAKDDFVLLTDNTLRPVRDYLQTRGKVEATDPLFTSMSCRNKNQRLTTRSVSRIIKEHLREIGLDSPRLTAHSLRHTAITLSLQAGATIQEAQVLGRHANINTTLIYAHNIDRIAHAPEKKIDAFLEGNGVSSVNYVY